MLVENELKKLKAFDSSYVKGKNYFVGDDDTQNYLVFQPMFKYFKKIVSNGRISAWKSKELSDESIKTPSISDNILNSLSYFVLAMTIVKFNESCLKQDKNTYTHEKITLFMK